jgi:hypothetical protein
MMTFTEFLNSQPDNLKGAWTQVETAWEEYLRQLHAHLAENLHKYDTHHAKFGRLASEHPDARLDVIVRKVEKHFEKMKEELSRLGAHQMI